MGDDPPPPSSFTITLKEVWDELRALGNHVAAMTPQGEKIRDQEKRLDTQDQRLNKIERWMYALPVSLLLATSSVAIAVIQSHH